MITARQCLDRYGSPVNENNMMIWDVPEVMERSAIPGKIYCNKDLQPALAQAIVNMIVRNEIQNLKTWDGCFSIRSVRGGSSASLHSWGLAVDVNASWNSLGTYGNMTPSFVRCFTDAGFTWGGGGGYVLKKRPYALPAFGIAIVRHKAPSVVGRVCKSHPHLNGLRSEKTNECFECMAESQARYYQKNRAKSDAKNSAWYAEHPEKVSEKNKAWYKNNVNYRSIYNKQYRQENKGIFAKHAANRRCYVLQRTPEWANEKYIEIFYSLAADETIRTGRKVHVDHIYPINSDWVCGLHCEHNLQLLFAEDNIRKSNKPHFQLKEFPK